VSGLLAIAGMLAAGASLVPLVRDQG